jgi:hypothetical protein
MDERGLHRVLQAARDLGRAIERLDQNTAVTLDLELDYLGEALDDLGAQLSRALHART